MKLAFSGSVFLLSYTLAAQNAQGTAAQSQSATAQSSPPANGQATLTATSTAQVAFTNLPPAVQARLQAEIGTNTFGEIQSELRDGQRLFSVPVQDNGRITQLVVSENGSVVSNSPITPLPAQPPLVLSASSPLLYEDLDPAVQRMIVVAAGAGPYEKIEREVRNGIPTYNVAFTNEGKYARVRLSEKGTVLEDTRETPSLTIVSIPEPPTNRMTLKDLPVAVQSAIKSRARAEEIQKVKLEDWLGKPVYTVSFYRDGDQHLFRIAKDGNIVQQPIIVGPAVNKDTNGVVVATTSLDPRSLPTAVQDTVKKHSQSAPITNVRQTVRDGQTVYDIEFSQNDHTGRLFVSEDGTLVLNEGTILNEAAGANIPPADRPIAFYETPAAVQRSLRIQSSGKIPNSLRSFVRDGRTVYEVEMERNGIPARIQVLEDGSVVKFER